MHYLTYEVAREMATEQRLRYAELTCTPYTSVRRPDDPTAGMPIEAYTEAIEAARVEAERDFGLVLRWIYDIPGEFGLPAADATLDVRARPPARGAGRLRARRARRSACPRPQFQPDFERRARSRAALGAARRRDHRPGDGVGRRCACSAPSGSGTAPRRPRTPRCSPTWPSTGIPLEVCPSSNIATRAVASLEEHPIRAFRDAGVRVTVNSDDPPMFGTTLNREYEVAADLLGLDEAGLADLARTGVRASFADDDVQGAGPGRDRRLRRRDLARKWFRPRNLIRCGATTNVRVAGVTRRD